MGYCRCLLTLGEWLLSVVAHVVDSSPDLSLKMRVFVPQMSRKWQYSTKTNSQKSLRRNDFAALAQMAEQRTRNLLVSPSQMALLGVNCPSQAGINVATSGVKAGVRPSSGGRHRVATIDTETGLPDALLRGC